MTDPSEMVQKFGPTPGAQATLTKLEVDLQIIPANEPSCITYTAYCVMLKKDTMAQLIENQGQTLGTLVENIHFTDVTHGVGIPAGQAFLNPQFFRILKKYTFQVGQELAGDGGNTQKQLSSSVFRKTFTVRPNKLLKNGRGDFDPAAVSTFRNDAQVYFIIFSDNIALDAQYPTITANCMLTVKS